MEQIKRELLEYVRARDMPIYTIRNSNFVKLGHPMDDDIRLCIEVCSHDLFILSLYVRSQFSHDLRTVTSFEELKYEICAFEFNGATLSVQERRRSSVHDQDNSGSEVIDVIGLNYRTDLDDMYEEMCYSCELGI